MPKKSGLETPHEVEIGKRVKRFRDLINWPQPAFANELGVSRDKLASIEYGRTPLKYAVGYRLCFIFDVSHQWLSTGEGEYKAATAALELPRPEDVPERSLWSSIAGKGHSKKAGKGAKPRKDELISNFDPTAHVVSFLGDLFTKEKFKSPVERQEFALEITSYARELALRIRRERTKERYLAVSGGAGKESDQHGTASTRTAGAVSGLREGIRGLERDLGKLNAAMEKGKSGSAHAATLSRTSEVEFLRLQDAIAKIAAQIQSVESATKILLAKKGE